MTQTVRTTCPYCGVGCGVIASLDDEGRVSISGDPDHPSNFGRLCSKGAALADTIGIDGRLLYPELEGEEVSWDLALNVITDQFATAIKQHGADSVAFYVSGQLLTEDYYVANKLMKGFIGSANIDTNSRLCMSSPVVAQKRAFGSDTVPCSYEDLERAKLIVLCGSNTAWCHPVLFQRITQAKQENPDLQIIVIDPRKTATCDIADLHLPIAAGSDHILFNGLLTHLHAQQESNPLFIEYCTQNLEPTLQAAKDSAPSIDAIASRCGLSVHEVEEFYRLFARTERVVTLYSQGINQWTNGTDRVNSIINCHLYTGRIGHAGMGPFSITGQPNAMGGREVGGLANQLAAHMNIEDAAHRDTVQSFWQSPAMPTEPGLKAVDLFNAMHEGKIKVLWIMATNPAVSMPDADFVREALQRCEFVIVSDCIRHTDTTQYANVLLPSQTWGERDGTVTNSERRISRQRKFLPSPGEVKADWWIIAEVAKRLGYGEQFNYQLPVDIYTEHAALSHFENDGQRDFDLGAHTALSDQEFEDLQPTQWPITDDAPNGTARMFVDGKFYTPSRRANFIAVTDNPPANACDDNYPLVLNTGRIRDHWHTMTRTGKSPTLSAHTIEAYAEIHPDDAAQYKIEDGGLVKVSSQRGNIIIRAHVSDSQRAGNIFVPMHWSNQFGSKATVCSLVQPDTDPFSGQPEFKHTPVSINPYQPAWYGFILSRRKLQIDHANYWSVSRGRGLWRFEIAGEETAQNWANCARSLLCQHADNIEWVEYFDPAATRYRAARIENGRLESCIFISPDHHLPERDWLARLLNKTALEEDERISLLTGQPGKGVEDAGRIVCACFAVGINVLTKAIKQQGLTNADAIGKALKAGTNCGSCVPELKQLIKDCQQ